MRMMDPDKKKKKTKSFIQYMRMMCVLYLICMSRVVARHFIRLRSSFPEGIAAHAQTVSDVRF